MQQSQQQQYTPNQVHKRNKSSKYSLLGFQYLSSNINQKYSIQEEPAILHSKLREQRRRFVNTLINPIKRDPLLLDEQTDEVLQSALRQIQPLLSTRELRDSNHQQIASKMHKTKSISSHLILSDREEQPSNPVKKPPIDSQQEDGTSSTCFNSSIQLNEYIYDAKSSSNRPSFPLTAVNKRTSFPNLKKFTTAMPDLKLTSQSYSLLSSPRINELPSMHSLSNAGESIKSAIELQTNQLKKAERIQRQLNSSISASMLKLSDAVIQRDHAAMLPKEVTLSGYSGLSNIGTRDNQSSLNMKILNEKVYSNNSFDIPFLRHLHRASVADPLVFATEKPNTNMPALLEKKKSIRLQSSHDADTILGRRRVPEKKEILKKVAHSLSLSKRTHIHPSEAYNKWYIEPKYRLLPKRDYSIDAQFPFRRDDEYLYYNMHQKELNKKTFDASLSKADDDSTQLKPISEYEKHLEHTRNVIQHIDVIHDFTEKLQSQGKRIPLFLKEVIQEDIGRHQSRQVFKNKYFNEIQNYN